jgi:hypothetical protein
MCQMLSKVWLRYIACTHAQQATLKCSARQTDFWKPRRQRTPAKRYLKELESTIVRTAESTSATVAATDFFAELALLCFLESPAFLPGSGSANARPPARGRRAQTADAWMGIARPGIRMIRFKIESIQERMVHGGNRRLPRFTSYAPPLRLILRGGRY